VCRIGRVQDPEVLLARFCSWFPQLGGRSAAQRAGFTCSAGWILPFSVRSGTSEWPAPRHYMSIVTAVMTYGADVGSMLAGAAALRGVRVSLRGRAGRHRKRPGRHARVGLPRFDGQG
jgi:hypothetical protein